MQDQNHSSEKNIQDVPNEIHPDFVKSLGDPVKQLCASKNNPGDSNEQNPCLQCEQNIKQDGKFSGVSYPAFDGRSVHEECWESFIRENAPKCLSCAGPVALFPGHFSGEAYELSHGLVHVECMKGYVNTAFAKCVHCQNPCCKFGIYSGASYELECGDECHVECYEAYNILVLSKNLQKQAIKILFKIQTFINGSSKKQPSIEDSSTRRASLNIITSSKPLRLAFGEQYGTPKDARAPEPFKKKKGMKRIGSVHKKGLTKRSLYQEQFSERFSEPVITSSPEAKASPKKTWTSSQKNQQESRAGFNIRRFDE